MQARAEANLLLDQIRQHVDPDYREGAQMATRTQLKLYGVRVPQIRQIARDWKREHKRVESNDLVTLVELMLRGESQEERLLAIELLRCYPKSTAELEWEHFEQWHRLMDNWSLIDNLGANVIGPWILVNPERRLAHLSDLIVDDLVWSRRIALVSTVNLNRSDETAIPDLTLQMIDQVLKEREPMITKAVSWALRELTKTHADRVRAYLDVNREHLHPHVVREVENKLRTGLKSGKVEP